MRNGPSANDLKKIAEAYCGQTSSHGKKKAPVELAAGPRFKYTSALAAWHIKRLRQVNIWESA